MTKEYSKQDIQKKFQALIDQQLERIDQIKADQDWIDYEKKDKIIIGICPGDGIGIEISKHAKTVLETVLAADIKNNRIELLKMFCNTFNNFINFSKLEGL